MFNSEGKYKRYIARVDVKRFMALAVLPNECRTEVIHMAN